MIIEHRQRNRRKQSSTIRADTATEYPLEKLAGRWQSLIELCGYRCRITKSSNRAH
jgi:hypothetical protein